MHLGPIDHKRGDPVLLLQQQIWLHGTSPSEPPRIRPEAARLAIPDGTDGPDFAEKASPIMNSQAFEYYQQQARRVEPVLSE